MSNLSELLPTGGGGKSVDFVANGTLGSGVTVALKSDGTVEAVSGVEQGVGTSEVFESASTYATSATFDSTNNKIVIAYQDIGNSNYGTAIVGTVSGTSISFGAAVVFESASTSIPTATYDSTNNKVVIAYKDNGNTEYGTAIVGTVSGTSISFGTAVVFESATVYDSSVTYDSSNNKVVIAYRDNGNANYGTAVVGTVSGTSISFGTPVVFETATSTLAISATYDSTNEKIVIAYKDGGNSNYGTTIVGTVSGTSISFGTAVVFESANSLYISATYDSTNNKVVIAYNDDGNSNYGTAIVGTVSGTSISFGTAVVFASISAAYNSAIYDSTNNKIVIAYNDGGNSNYGTATTGIVSGTSISFGTPVVFENASTEAISATFDSTNNKIVIAYQDIGNSNFGTSVVFQTGATNSADFIGITDQAIADTATGAVIVQGGVSEKVSGLTTGSDYYVQSNGTLSTTVSTVPAGRALSSTSILLEG
jgi:hypothetical protein